MSRGWTVLPPEMHLSVLDLLTLDDLKAFSVVNRTCRQLAMSPLFKVCASVRVPNPVCVPTLVLPVRQAGWLRSCGIIPLPLLVKMPYLYSITLCFNATGPVDAAMRLRFVPDRPPCRPPIHLHNDSIPHALRVWINTKTSHPTVCEVDPSYFAVYRKYRA